MLEEISLEYQFSLNSVDMSRDMFIYQALVLIALICLQSLVTSQRGDQLEMILVIHEFELCPGRTKDIARFKNRTINNLGRGKTAVSAIIHLQRDVEHMDKTLITVTKCRSRSEPASCERIFKFDLGPSCPFILQKNQIWSPFFDSVKPNFRCPIKKGEYTLNNATFNAKAVAKVVSDFLGSYWKLKVDLRNAKEKIACVVVGIDADMARRGQ